MNSKRQEADRVRMERALVSAGMDAKQELELTMRVTTYDERARAWERLAKVANAAHQTLTGYMEDYGLAKEVN